MALLPDRATMWLAMMFLRAYPAPSFSCGTSRIDFRLEFWKLMVCGYLPQTAALTMLAWNMSTSNSSRMTCVTAAAAAVKPVVYSTPASNLVSGTMMIIFFPSIKVLTSVSSSLVVFRISLVFFAIFSAFATIARFISRPRRTPPPTWAVLRPFSIAPRSTAIVLLARETVRFMAGLYRGLIASRGTCFSITLPLSSYKSTLSLYFAMFYLLFYNSTFTRDLHQSSENRLPLRGYSIKQHDLSLMLDG